MEWFASFFSLKMPSQSGGYFTNPPPPSNNFQFEKLGTSDNGPLILFGHFFYTSDIFFTPNTVPFQVN